MHFQQVWRVVLNIDTVMIEALVEARPIGSMKEGCLRFVSIDLVVVKKVQAIFLIVWHLFIPSHSHLCTYDY
jgi:hypothetical protein